MFRRHQDHRRAARARRHGPPHHGILERAAAALLHDSVLGAGGLGAAGYWAYERQQEKLHQSAIIWHGADKGARPPTEQVFFPPEERGEMPQWKRIWRTTTPSGFNREGDTELVAEEGQQPTV